MIKIIIPVIIFIGFSSCAFSQQTSVNPDSVLLKKKAVHLQTRDNNLPLLKEVSLSKPTETDSRYPVGFPKFIPTGDTEKDKSDYHNRIAIWKKENPIKAEELLRKGLIK